MSLLQALTYFASEAFKNLVRGWRISSLSIATTALSLFIGGLLVLLGGNLARAVDDWRTDARIVVFMNSAASPEERAAMAEELRSTPWADSVVEVGSAQARRRLLQRFPDLRAVLDDLEKSPLPLSFEVQARGEVAEMAEWLSSLSARPEVSAVENDSEWLDSMDAAADVARALGLLVGGVLMVAAAISIASVVRLSTFVYRKEIATMRLIGATEFFVRGPFVIEGIAQGVAGSAVALAGLWASYWGLGELDLPWFVQSALLGSFLTMGQAIAVSLVGGVAGLIGGVMPLRERSGIFG